MSKNLLIEKYIPAIRLEGKVNTNYAISAGGGVTVPTGKTVTVTDSSALVVGGNIVPTLEYVTSPVFAAASFVSGTAYPFYTFPNDGTTWAVKAVSLRYTTASSSGTVDIGVAASGTAPSSATTQLTGTISTSSTANTVNNGTIIASPTTISPGAALVATSGGTVTGLVNLVITVALQRLS